MLVIKDVGILEANLEARQGILQIVTYLTFCYIRYILLHILHSVTRVTFCYIEYNWLHLVTFSNILLHFVTIPVADFYRSRKGDFYGGKIKGDTFRNLPRVCPSLSHAILIDRMRAFRSFRKS